MSINSVTISGNLTRDPELRYSVTGTAILTFCVAVNERKKNSQGEWEDYANFVDCVLFGKYGEAMQQHLVKGSKVAVSGKLHYSSWERDGQRRSKLEVVVDEVVTFVQQRQQQPAYGAPAPAAPPAHSVPQTPVPKVDGVYDEDIPF